MAAHTPGPWRIAGIGEFNGGVNVCSGLKFVALIGADEEDPTVAKDARLIAAAPDLLDALEGVANRWDTADDEDAPELGKLLRSALLKARG